MSTASPLTFAPERTVRITTASGRFLSYVVTVGDDVTDVEIDYHTISIYAGPPAPAADLRALAQRYNVATNADDELLWDDQGDKFVAEGRTAIYIVRPSAQPNLWVLELDPFVDSPWSLGDGFTDLAGAERACARLEQVITELGLDSRFVA